MPHLPTPLRAATAAAVIATAACTDNAFSGDPFPIRPDRASGAVVVHVRRGGDPTPIPASLDVLAPFTILDPGPGAAVRRRTETLTVLGRSADGAELIARARLTADAFELHPCADDTCSVGSPDMGLTAVGAVIGADALAGDAVRFDFAANQLYILPDIAGEDSARNRVCDAVFQAPFRGGGTLIVDGAELPFGGRRISLGACANADPRDREGVAVNARPTGGDLLLVLSTGVGVTILGESGFARIPGAERLEESIEVQLVSGPVVGQHGRLTGLSLAATAGSDPRGPCREVFAHRLVTRRPCEQAEVDAGTCPCQDTGFCGAPAILDLRPTGGIPVLILPDDHDLLQSLRAELRPDQAEVDGILGADALAQAVIDVDYPHNRVLARCAVPGCEAWPQLVSEADRDAVRGCIPSETAPPVDAGVDAPPVP